MSAVLGYQQVFVRPRRSVVISTRIQLAIVVTLIAVLGMKVWIQSAITDLGYRIGHERARARDLDSAIRELTLAHSVLVRPRTLQEEAKARLGLVPLAPNQALRISSRQAGGSHS